MAACNQRIVLAMFSFYIVSMNYIIFYSKVQIPGKTYNKNEEKTF